MSTHIRLGITAGIIWALSVILYIFMSNTLSLPYLLLATFIYTALVVATVGAILIKPLVHANQVARLAPQAGLASHTKQAFALDENIAYQSWLNHYDPKTSLPNRVFFNETLTKVLPQAKRSKQIVAILHVAINNPAADAGPLSPMVIKELGKRFSQALRAGDLIAKLDGDEFMVLLANIEKPKFASSVASKLIAACNQPIKVIDQYYNFTLSIGISIYPNDATYPEDLLLNAEVALFNAKQVHGSHYQFYSETLDNEAHAYIELGSALRTALADQGLTLYYQPKLHLKKGTIVGVEALIRWVHPQLGVISPADFIPIAEEIGLTTQIGEWVLREACKKNKFWQDEGYEHMVMAVNLSPKQFFDPGLPQLIKSILDETKLNPIYLELEIDEATVMSNMQNALTVLQALKALDVQLSLSHFGTGYTSISHLKHLPINIIKLDANFVKGVPNNPDDTVITNAMISLVHNLGLEVLAEGVETPEQAQYLASEQCDMVQGYFLSHPQPADKIVLQFKKLTDKVLF